MKTNEHVSNGEKKTFVECQAKTGQWSQTDWEAAKVSTCTEWPMWQRARRCNGKIMEAVMLCKRISQHVKAGASPLFFSGGQSLIEIFVLRPNQHCLNDSLFEKLQ